METNLFDIPAFPVFPAFRPRHNVGFKIDDYVFLTPILPKFWTYLLFSNLLRAIYDLQGTFLVLFCLHNHVSVHLCIYSVPNEKLVLKLN